MRTDWQNVMTPEEVDEFGALEEAIAHTKSALTALSRRRGQVRNRLVQRIAWRKEKERRDVDIRDQKDV